MSEPSRVTPLNYAHPALPYGQKWAAASRYLCLLSWFWCALAWWLIIKIDVTTVLWTGPVLFSMGILLLVGSIRVRARWVGVVAIGHCGICLLFFAEVNLGHWSPERAHNPFVIMGAAYAICDIIPVTIALIQLRNSRQFLN